MANIRYGFYKKVEIEKSSHNNYYVVLSKIGYLKADTLKGIKTLINSNYKECFKI